MHFIGTLTVWCKPGNALRKVFGEKELTCVGDVPTAILAGNSASDMNFDMDVDGPAGVPSRIERCKLRQPAVTA
jgi:hypothetical protein